MRLIEVVADAGHTDTLAGIADQHEITDYWWGASADDGRRSFRMLVSDGKRQAVMDALQSLFGGSETHRIVVLRVDTVLPGATEDVVATASATREELFSQLDAAARIDSNYLLLVVLSTLVAAIGLAEDNVAVVIGAMVIAPLLGPVLALAFGSSLGDGVMMWRALRTCVAGLSLAFVIALLIGWLLAVDTTSSEILARTNVGLDSLVLALVSGAAAVLSLTTGLSSTLVGVMVAVALLPPTATTGLLLSGAQPQLAAGALLLLAVNIVSVVVAAKLVFLVKGVRPRTWYQRKSARQSTWLAGAFWLGLLLILSALVLLRQQIAP